MLRSFVISVLCTLPLAGLAHAGSVQSVSFSGTWGSSGGVIHAGDAFSGTASWDGSTVTNPYPFCPAPCTWGPLLSFSLTMPAADGLSVEDLSSPQMMGGPIVVAYSAGAFTNGFVQVFIRSTVDNNIYEFVFTATLTGTAASSTVFTPNITPISYSLVGPTTAIYDFSAPRFLAGQTAPFSAIAPNVGDGAFLADFNANSSSYAVVDNPPWTLFSGQYLKSQCFCAQTLRITFNKPVYTAGVNFASVGVGFTLTLTSAAGSASATSTSAGGSLQFSSVTPFTWIELGTGVFAIDNLTLNTEPPTPPTKKRQGQITSQ